MKVDHIKDNKDLYANDIEENFDEYIQNMKNNDEWVGVELFKFSSMIDKNWALDRYQQ